MNRKKTNALSQRISTAACSHVFVTVLSYDSSHLCVQSLLVSLKSYEPLSERSLPHLLCFFTL